MYEFTTLVNFRDLGGLTGAEGKKVKPRRLLRSAKLADLPPEDVALLENTYQLRNIFDLRGEDETKKQPDMPFAAAAYHNLDIMRDMASKNAGMEAMFSAENRTPEKDAEGMRFFYSMMVTDEHARSCWRSFLDVLLAQESGSALFHCFVGKDRTGMAAAIILTALGVSWEDIMADYMVTNELRRADNERIFNEMRAEGKTENEIACMRVAFGAQESFLQSAHDTAVKEYGSFEAFLREGLGLTDAETARLREMYLE